MVRASTSSVRDGPAAGKVGRDDANSPVHRALAILELLGSDEVTDPLGVVDIARRLGRDKSQISRALRVLADAGFVDREPHTLRYRIGTRLFAIAADAVGRRLRDESERATRRLAALIGERAEVAVRNGHQAMTISSSAPDRALLAVGRVGWSYSLHTTAAGRCLLFDLDDAELARLLTATGLDSRGPRAPRSYDDVLTRLRAETAQGYSVCVNEDERDLLAVGAPIRDGGGLVVGGLQVCGPSSRLEEALDEVTAHIVGTAAAVSTALGAHIQADQAHESDPRPGPAAADRPTERRSVS